MLRLFRSIGYGLLMSFLLVLNAQAAEKIKVSLVQPESDPQAQAMKDTFKKYVEDKTNGKYEVDIYTGGALGNFDTIFQGAQFGTINIATDSSSNLSAFAKQLALCDLPYIFPSIEAAQYVFEQPVGEQILDSLKKKKVTPLGVVPSTFRIVPSTIPLEKLEDIQGLKWRTTASKVHMDAIRALGASPTPMPSTEMLTGLQQGVVKALDQDANSWLAYGIIDVAPYAMVTNHIPVVYVLYSSSKWLDSLPEEDRKIILEGLELYKKEARRLYDEAESDVLNNKAPARGGKVVRLDDAEKARWKEKGMAAYKNLSDVDRAVAEEILRVGTEFENQRKK